MNACANRRHRRQGLSYRPCWHQAPTSLDERELRCVTNTQSDLQLTPRLLDGLVPNGPTDPIAYYKRPLIGRFYRERINLGLRMIAGRRYAKALEVGYGAGAVLLAIAPSVDELQ